MDLSQLHPSNWFKHEEGENKNTPAHRGHKLGRVSPFGSVHDELDRVFDGFFRDAWPSHLSPFSGGTRAGMFKPSLDLKATDKQYRISVELPGVDEKDIAIEIDKDVLVICGEKKSETKSGDEDKGFYRMERSYGSFRRVLALPEDSEPESISATFKNGVLNIAIPRVETQEKKQIAISS